jgi:hypothetical protein
MSQNNQFIDTAVESGFTLGQAEFMDEMLAKFPHTHNVMDIDGLDVYVEEMVDEGMGVDGTDGDIEDDGEEDE